MAASLPRRGSTSGSLPALAFGVPSGSPLLLDGPPGIGGSTVARLLVRARPLAPCLDVDLLRRSLGQWMDHPDESGALGRDLALAAAVQHLRSGHEVVVPQFVGRQVFVERLERLAAELGVPFVHVALLDDERAAAARFLAREHAPEATEQHLEAAAMAGGESHFDEMYDALRQRALHGEQPHRDGRRSVPGRQRHRVRVG